MPRRPKKPCAHPGCPELVEAGERYCKVHKRQEQKRYDQQRGTAAQRGYNSRWRRYREWYLKQHPLCVQCQKEGRLIPATDVDHIIPVSGPDDPLFWDEKNHQALCHSCHSRKTAKENGGFGNASDTRIP